MKDVFISYKNEEFDEANWVKTTLETNGISCWMAPMSIPGGSSYATEIPIAIRNCKVFVLILSERSQLSKWVPRELDQAINAGKTVLPFMLEDCPLKDDFNFYLTNVQRYAAYESKTKAIEKMLREIKAILGVNGTAVKPSDADSALNDTVTTDGDVTDTATVEKPSATAETVETKAVETKAVETKAVNAEVPEKPVAEVEKVQTKTIETSKSVGKTTAVKTKTVGKAAATPEKKKALKKYIAVCCFAVALVLMIVGIIISKEMNSVVIGGQKFYTDASMVDLNGKTLTLSDVEAFKEFDDLGSVYLTDCTLPDDIDAVFNAKYTVSLNNCGISNAQLKSVDLEDSSLSTLILDNNKSLTDISAVAPLKGSLNELSFNGCGVSDISFLKGFDKLVRLSADNNRISDISALGECAGLEVLNAQGNEITSLEVFGSHKLLENIDLSSNKLNDLNGLEASISLKNISVADNSITDISGLANTTLLENVDLSRNSISDISLLSASATKLKTLKLDGNSVSDISCLTAAAQMTELRADGNGISDISALKDMTELKTLSLADNNIADISGISECKKLTYLDLSDNAIVSTKGLPQFLNENSYGIDLDVSNNGITELVLPAVRYKLLKLYGNEIADLSAVNTTTGDTVVFDYNAGIDFTALGNGGYYDYYIFDCPLYKQVSIGEALNTHKTHFTTLVEYTASEN